MSNRSTMRLLASAMLLTSCSSALVNKDLSDTTPPQAVFKVRDANGQFTPATSATLSVSGTLDLVCLVSDAGGVKMLDLTFSAPATSCTTGTGTVYNGAFSVTPLPAELHQTLQGDASGKVLSSLPMYATLAGPFTCSIPGTGTGIPYGATIKVTCEGQNWSQVPQKNVTVAVLPVKLQ